MYQLFKCPCAKQTYDKQDINYENDPLSSYTDVLPRKIQSEDKQTSQNLGSLARINTIQETIQTSQQQKSLRGLKKQKQSIIIIRYIPLIAQSQLFNFIIQVSISVNVFLLIFSQNITTHQPNRYDLISSELAKILYICLIIIYWIEIVIKLWYHELSHEQNSFWLNFDNIINLTVCLLSSIFFNQGFFYLSILRVSLPFQLLSNLALFRFTRQILRMYKMAFKQLTAIICLILFFLTLFSIIGANLWADRMDSMCRVNPQPINGSWPLAPDQTRLCSSTYSGYQCPESTYCGSNYAQGSQQQYNDTDILELNFGFTTFQNVGSAYLTIIQVFFIEGWAQIMYQLQDATDPYLPTIFFVVFFIICTFFLSNLIVAVFLKQFSILYDEQEKSQKLAINEVKFDPKTLEKNIKIIGIYGQPLSIKTLYGQTRVYNRKNSGKNLLIQKEFQQFIKTIVKSPILQISINSAVFINLLILSYSQYPDPSERANKILILIQMIIISIFLAEDVIRYMPNKSNLSQISFELLIDIMSMTQVSSFESLSYISALKGIRLFWLLDSQTMWSSYQVLTNAINQSFNEILNLILIWALFMIQAAVIGRWLYEDKLLFDNTYKFDSINGISPRSNFDDILQSLSTVLQALVGDDWNYVWYACQKARSPWIAHFYFIPLIFFGKFILKNSFITIMLGNFKEARKHAEYSKLQAEQIISKFQQRRTMRPNNKEETFKQVKSFTNRWAARVVPMTQSKRGQLQSAKTNQPSTIHLTQNRVFYSSLCIFHYNSWLRSNLKILNDSIHFKRGILLINFCQAIVLIIDNPMDDPNGQFKQTLNTFNIIFTIIFMLEMCIKVITQGFFKNYKNDRKSYIRNYWNLLDLFVLITSIIDVINLNRRLRALRCLKLLQVLQPLLLTSKNEQLKLLITAFLQTLPLLGTLLVVSGIMIWVSAIVCMHLFKGTFFYCDEQSVLSKDQCLQLGHQWILSHNNFDNILNSMINILKFIIGDNWMTSMILAIDHKGINLGPQKNYQPAWLLLFQALISFNNIIILNLFIGLIINNFQKIKEETGGCHNLNVSQQKWIEMQRIMQRKDLIIIIEEPKYSTIRLFCFNLMKNEFFEVGIIFLVFLNTLALGFYQRQMSAQEAQILQQINNVFLIIFNLEAVIKLLGSGYTMYFLDSWNRFDCTILFLNNISMIWSTQGLLVNLNINSIPVLFRALRLGRLVKYVRAFPSLKLLIDSIYYILPCIWKLSLLTFLIIFMYAILGMHFFPFISNKQDYISYPNYLPSIQSSRENFQSFWDSITVLLQYIQFFMYKTFYRIRLGQSYNCQPYQTFDQIQQNGINECGAGWLSYVYFISYVVLLYIIMANLFLAMVIEGFFDTLQEEESIINSDQMQEFFEKWAEFDPEGTGFIAFEDLIFLLFELPPPLGFKEDIIKYNFSAKPIHSSSFIVHTTKKFQLQKKQVFRSMKNFNIPLYENKKIHIKDVCIQLSYQVACIMTNSDRIEIQSKYVNQSLEHQWNQKYPDLEGNLQKSTNIQFYSLEQFAIKCLQVIIKDLIYKRRLKILFKQEQIQAKLSDQLFGFPIKKKQAQQNKPSHQFSSTRMSYLKHQQNYPPKEDTDTHQSQRISKLNMDSQVSLLADRNTYLNQSNSVQTQSEVSQNIHNFFLDKEFSIDGWPEHVRVVQNGIDMSDKDVEQEIECSSASNKKKPNKFIRPQLEYPIEKGKKDHTLYYKKELNLENEQAIFNKLNLSNLEEKDEETDQYKHSQTPKELIKSPALGNGRQGSQFADENVFSYTSKTSRSSQSSQSSNTSDPMRESRHKN